MASFFTATVSKPAALSPPACYLRYPRSERRACLQGREGDPMEVTIQVPEEIAQHLQEKSGKDIPRHVLESGAINRCECGSYPFPLPLHSRDENFHPGIPVHLPRHSIRCRLLSKCVAPRCDGIKYEELPSWEALWDKHDTVVPCPSLACGPLRICAVPLVIYTQTALV
jgi:hypothetical protein